MNFDENPIRTPFDTYCDVEPRGEAVSRRQMRVRTVDRAVFEAWEYPPNASSKVESERTLENQKAVFGSCTSNTRTDAGLVRSRPLRIIDRIVDAIDGPGLRWVGSGGQCEVGITTRVAENGELVVDAAPSTVRTGIVECPVSVHESEGDAAVGTASQQAVSPKELVDELGEPVMHRSRRIMVMVKMDFNITESSMAQLCKSI